MTTGFDPIPSRQILSYRVRGPELAALFHLLAREGPISFESLSASFAGTVAPGRPRKDDLLLEALDFLRAMELVGRWRDENDAHVYQILDVDAALPFQLLLLQQLGRMPDNRDALRVVHDMAVRQDLFFTSKSDLLKQLESAYLGEYAWNAEKLRSWEWLSSYLGLIRSLDPRQADLMICPQPELLVTALQASVASGQVKGERQGDQAQVLISAWLDYVEANCFRCFTERHEVHRGLSSALLAMEAAGQIKLDMLSDAPGAPLLRERRVSHIRFSPAPEE